MTHLLYLGIGLTAGIAGGLFGIGGAIIMIPLLLAAGYSQHLAQGTTVGALLFPIGALAAYKYWQHQHINIGAALGIAFGFFLGGWIGAHFAHQIDPTNMRKLFGLLLIGVGIKTVLGK